MNSIEKASRLIRQIGGETYIVGGAVRDLVMGNEPNDIDIATGKSIEEIKASDLHTYEIGQSMSFGIVGVSFQGEEYEVAHFRNDGDYTDNRRPDSVDLNASLQEDSERRDFTINAMYMDADGQIVDPHNGQRDIQKKMIRAVGDPYKRFEEDALRIIRAHRFAARFGFKIEAKTKAAMIKNVNSLKNIAVERIAKELIKVAEYGGVAMAQFIEDTMRTNVIYHIIPEIIDTTYFHQHFVHHPEGALAFETASDYKRCEPYSIKKHGKEPGPDWFIENGSVYDHIIAALRTYKGNDPLVTLGILFHDIGKPATAELHPKRDSYKFIGHDRAGVHVFEEIAKRLKFSSKMTEAINFVIANHMRFHAVPKKATKIIPIRQSKYYNILKQVAFADDSCRGEAFDPAHHNEVIDAIEDIYRRFGEKEEFDARMRELINGNIIKEVFPEVTGSEIGKVIKEAKEFVIERDFKVTKEDVIEFIKSKKEKK